MGITIAVASAFWLGILTSISPCPLATNVAAVSYIGRHMASPRRVFAAGVIYTLGRSFAYLLVAALLIASLLSAPQLSQLLQGLMSKLMGPLLVVVGMVLLDLLPVHRFGLSTGQAWQQRTAAWGVVGAGILGFVFALSFCPVSAALFFGSLLPLALDQQSPWLLPAAYGLGTGLPVLFFGGLIAMGVRTLGTWFNRLATFETAARAITGWVFILIGLYLTAMSFLSA